MASTPKETKTSVEPWSGSKDYLKDAYAQFDKLIKNGAPEQFKGDTVATQSKATLDALNGTENLARNGDKSVLNNATKTVNSVMNQVANTPANQTLTDLQKGVNLGKNPTDSIASGIANGTTQKAPGSYDQAKNFTNPATQNAGNMTNYQNSAIGNIQQMLGSQNPAMQNASQFQNFTNGAVGQAANLNGFTNAASGLQTQQANDLANSNNPALAYLQQTASGANIGNNPWLQQNIAAQQAEIADQLKNITNPGIDSAAVAAGRMGSGAFASQRNNAKSTAAKAMSDVAVNALQGQYNQDVSNQMNAANSYGNLANQDVANRMNANANLANTSNSQQQNRISGIGLSGDLQNSQNQARMAGTELYNNMYNQQFNNRLNANQQLGSFNDSQNAARLSANQQLGQFSSDANQQRLNAINSQNDQFNADRNYQLAGMQQLSNNYQNNIQNMLSSNDQRLNAANSQNSYQSNLNNQRLQAADMSANAYQNQYLPYQQLAGVGEARDTRNQDVLNSKIAKWDYDQQLPLQNSSNFVNLLNGGNYSTTTTPVYNNTLGQIGGLASGLAGLFALCDARLKQLHKLVGFLPLTNGEQIAMYEFSYKDDPEDKRWIGPIAQEVEAKTDTATVIEFDGVKVINVESMLKEAA